MIQRKRIQLLELFKSKVIALRWSPDLADHKTKKAEQAPISV